MVNLHEANMRRSMSQMETKQSQSSLYNDEINKDNKYKTQTNRFLFINDKEKNKVNKINNDEFNNIKIN